MTSGLQDKVQTDKLLTGLMAGLVAGLIATLTDIIPMAAFVFSGNLEPYVATGIGINFLPYPVVGGYLAGLGCLLSLGGLQVMADVGTIAQLPLIFQPDLLLRWIPGVAFAIALLMLTHRYKHILVVPVSFIGVTSLFYLVLSLTRTSVATAFEQRWLLGPFLTGQLWKPVSLLNLTHVNWTLILSQLPGMFALMLITALSILLVSSGIELVMEQDIDLNQELKAAGIANILSGLLGGIVGSHTIGATLLACKIGGKSQLTGVVVSVFYLVVLFAGLSLLSFFPRFVAGGALRFVAGGALLFIGIPLIISWVYEGWFKLSRIDYAIMLLITGIVATIGFMEGVVVGLVAAIALMLFTFWNWDKWS